MKRNAVLSILLISFMTIGCSRNIRVNRAQPQAIKSLILEELGNPDTHVHIIQTDGNEHLVRSVVISEDSLHYGQYLQTIPEEFPHDPLLWHFPESTEIKGSGGFSLHNLSKVRYLSRKFARRDAFLIGTSPILCAGISILMRPTNCIDYSYLGWMAIVTSPLYGLLLSIISYRSYVELVFYEGIILPPPSRSRDAQLDSY